MPRLWAFNIILVHLVLFIQKNYLSQSLSRVTRSLRDSILQVGFHLGSLHRVASCLQRRFRDMASSTGPPQGTLRYMTPYPIAAQPPTPKPIPDVVHPEQRPAERAAERFSLAGRSAIGTSPFRHYCSLINNHSDWWSSGIGLRLCSCYARAWT